MPTVQEFIPGDPGGVLRLADQVQGAAQQAEDAQHELQNVVQHGQQIPWEGRHAEAFRHMVAGMPQELGLMASSYFRSAEALRAYGQFLDGAQRRAAAAVERYQEADSQRAVAESERSIVTAQLRSVAAELTELRIAAAALAAAGAATTVVAGTDPMAAQRDAIAQREGELSAAHGRLTGEQSRLTATVRAATERRDAALRDLRQLADERHDHEHTCSLRVRGAVEADLRNRSWASSILAAIGSVLPVVGGIGLGVVRFAAPALLPILPTFLLLRGLSRLRPRDVGPAPVPLQQVPVPKPPAPVGPVTPTAPPPPAFASAGSTVGRLEPSNVEAYWTAAGHRPLDAPDPWGKYTGWCTSWVGFRRASLGLSVPSGNGGAMGHTTAPPSAVLVGSVVSYGAGTTQDYGHVMFVEEVYPDGRIRVSQMNADWKGGGPTGNVSERTWTPTGGGGWRSDTGARRTLKFTP